MAGRPGKPAVPVVGAFLVELVAFVADREGAWDRGVGGRKAVWGGRDGVVGKKGGDAGGNDQEEERSELHVEKVGKGLKRPLRSC